MGAAETPVQLKVDFAQGSDPGRDPNKQINEDSCGYVECKFGHLAVLCDGMGGHYGGQEASRRAITTIFETVERTPPGTPAALALKSAIEEAARKVYELGGPPDNRARPGTTVVAMLLHDAGVEVAHVGDSRAYVIRAKQIYPLTRDHSMVQGLIDSGQLREEEAIGHPDANKITRALGMKPDVDVEVRPEPMELFSGDMLLQTSDGLTDLALSHEILKELMKALDQGSLEFACKELIRMANERGGHDNITVQLARVRETGPRNKTAAPSPTQAGAPPKLSLTTPMGQPASAPAANAPASNAPTFGAPPQTPSPGGVSPTVPGGGPNITPAAPPAPIVTTAPDHGPAGVGPTMVSGADAPPPSGPVWSSGMYNGPGGSGAGNAPGGQAGHAVGGGAAAHANLAAYNLDGAGAPPPPAATPNPGAAAVGPTLGDYQQPMGSAPLYGAYPTVAPQGSGTRLLFLILGASVAIAVLIVAVLWGTGFLD